MCFSRVGNAAMWGLNGTVHSFRARLPSWHGIRRLFQAFESRLASNYGDGTVGKAGL